MKIIYLKIAIFILFVFVWPLGVNAKNPDDMILISTGKFVMGWDQGADDAKPAHHVFLDAFLIDLHEVTQKAFEKIMGYNPSKFSGEIRPVENMDWFEANDFCAKVGKRLPTEAEWEKAARGGKSSVFSWGDEPDPNFSWFAQNWTRGHYPVGQKKPNQYGLYDMAGNVWEWVEDWYDENYYKKNVKRNPKGPKKGPSQEKGGYKIVRGGSWGNPASFIQPSRRYKIRPTGRGHQFGFRCAKSK